MSPQDLDRTVLQVRLALMRDLLDDLDPIAPVTEADLLRDRMLRHAVERILGQLVELAVSVNGHVAATVLGTGPADYRHSFDLMQSAGILSPDLAGRLSPSVGLRNVLAHEYVRVDLQLVALAVDSAVLGYTGYVREIARWLDSL